VYGHTQPHIDTGRDSHTCLLAIGQTLPFPETTSVDHCSHETFSVKKLCCGQASMVKYTREHCSIPHLLDLFSVHYSLKEHV
jgi:hypothetical protein